MESPVVLDKPPEYHGSDVNRGFPFEDEEGSGAWSELAARHPDIAARLRQRPASATWARKRRPSSQDATEENFGNFDRFPFDDIPPEFREHFPSHWNRGFGSREEGAPPPPPPAAAGSPPHHASTATAGTQTERTQPEPAPSDADTDHLQSPLPQYGLRNTVDLGQKSPADPSLVDADDRTHRSMSAPPSARPPPDMSSQRPEPPPHQDPPSKVRVIPIHVEGRDEPAMPRAETKPQHAPHIDRAQYFTEEPAPSYHHPTYFSRAFDTPGTKAFRQGSQPFTQQKAYPQAASFTRGTSPQRAPQPRPPPDDHFVKVPVQHEHASPSPAAPPAPPAAAPAAAPREHTPPPPKPTPTDPITQILSIQTDVLNLMNEVENFAGCKKDKRYLFLDEMLTRNLIKLDNIETEGKENIRLARREAIKCIQKCIAVLEAKAEKNGKPKETNVGNTKEPDVDMKEVQEDGPTPATENGEVEMKEEPLPQAEQVESHKASEETAEAPLQAEPTPPASVASLPEPNPTELKPEEQNVEVQDKPSPKKKVVKKRDKSKDKAPANSVEAAKDSIIADANVEVMKVDNKGDKTEQVMDVDGAASQ